MCDRKEHKALGEYEKIMTKYFIIETSTFSNNSTFFNFLA